MEIKGQNNTLTWAGKAKDFNGWAKATEDYYGKETLLIDVIKDMKEKRLKKQVKFMKERYGINK